MKNPATGLVKSVLQFFQSPFRIHPSPDRERGDMSSNQSRAREQAVAPLAQEQLRIMLRDELKQMLCDPNTARTLLRPMIGSGFPFAGGVCGTFATTIGHGDFGASCSPADSGDYTFSNSKVGIGTASPARPLHIKSATAPVIRLEDSTVETGLFWELQQSAWNVDTFGIVRYVGTAQEAKSLFITNAGNVGIGIATPSTKLHVAAGSVSGSGAGIVLSEATGDVRHLVLNQGSSGSSKRAAISLAKGGVEQFLFGMDRGGGGAQDLFLLDTVASPAKVLFLLLKPNGSTDGTQINDAIAALPSNGGIIYLSPGEYQINTKITIAKNGVKLRGYGALRDKPTHTPLTTLKWTSSSHDTMIEMKPSGTTDWLEDLEITDVVIDGNDVAMKGLVLDRVQASHFRRFQVLNMNSSEANNVGIELTTTASVNDLGCSWNHFEDFGVINCYTCLLLTRNTSGGAVANISHNTFISAGLFVSVGNSGVAGILLKECDNNSFIRMYILAGTAGYAVIVDDPHHAQSNYFYHLQPDRGFRVNNSNTTLGTNDGKNIVFGYDRSNGQPAPTTDTDTTSPLVLNAKLFVAWADWKGEMYGFHVNS